MIHILTVHWNDESWIDIQLSFLKKHIRSPFKVYAFLNGIPAEYQSRFFYCSTEPVQRHEVKLNILADIAAFNAEGEDDLLMFLDGDAFPIGDIISFGYEKLKRYRLAAVQRLENCGDIQPHPCFCITTLKFWKEIKGDWKKGYCWKNSKGISVTDVGGNLLKILKEKEIEWYPMLRSNKKNIHSLLFGVYENLIYHHGAAFREPVTRRDWVVSKSRSKLIKILPKKIRKKYAPKVTVNKEAIQENIENSSRVFDMIKNDPEFYRYFLKPSSE